MSTAWLTDKPSSSSGEEQTVMPPQSLQPFAQNSTRSKSLEEMRDVPNLLKPESSGRLRSSSNGDLVQMATEYLRVYEPPERELHKMGSSVSLSARPKFLTGYGVPSNPEAFFVVGRVSNLIISQAIC